MKIAILGMPDNIGTIELLAELKAQDVPVSCVIYWKPGFKDQLRRVIRKFKATGVRQTLQRIVFAFTKPSKSTGDSKATQNSHIKSYYVSSHQSDECAQIIKNEGIDLTLLSTDAIISRRVFSASRFGTLNAHPGWIPRFRGLGALQYSLESGIYPSVSIHLVDEGIDTGPLVDRTFLELDPKLGLNEIEKRFYKFRHEFFIRVVKKIIENNGNFEAIDTFSERSSMTRGYPQSKRAALDESLQSGKITLYSPISHRDELIFKKVG